MSASKTRPRRISEPTRTYNAIFPVTLLEKTQAKAEEVKVSLAAFIRGAVEAAVWEAEDGVAETAPWDKEIEGADDRAHHPDPGEKVHGYIKGVKEACDIILDSTRLKIRMATGQTIGEDLVTRIKKDLGVEDQGA